MKKIVLAVIALSLLFSWSHAQNLQLEERLEQDKEYGRLFALESEKLVEINYDKKASSRKTHVYRVNIYSSDLEIVEEYVVELNNEYYLVTNSSQMGVTSVGLLNSDPNKFAVVLYDRFGKEKNAAFIFINLESGSVEVIENPMPRRTKDWYSFYIDDKITFIGQDNKQGFFMLEMEEGAGHPSKPKFLKILPKGMKNKSYKLDNVEYIESEGKFYASALRYEKDVKMPVTEIMTISMDGRVESRTDFTPEKGFFYFDISFIPQENGTYYLTGSVSDKWSGKNMARMTLSPYSSAFFITEWENNELNFHKSIPYTDMDSITYYYIKGVYENRIGNSEAKAKRRMAKIDAKKKKREEKGKDEKYWQVALKVRDVEVINGMLIVPVEFFSPYYITETTTNSNGMQTTRTRLVGFFQQSGGLIALNEKDGEYLWDVGYTMPFGQYTWHLPNMTQMNTGFENEIHVAFAAALEINYFIFDYNGQRTFKKEGVLEPEEISLDAEMVKNRGRVSFNHWYDNNYIITGAQKIRDNDASFGNKRRNVNFLSKYSYSPR